MATPILFYKDVLFLMLSTDDPPKKDVVMEDYLRSNENIIPMYREVIDGAVASGIEEEIPLAILGVRKEYLETAFEEMETKYGTIEKYFSEGLGIGAEQQKSLRDMYLDGS